MLDSHTAAATSHCESALRCGVLKESPESITKAIRVRLTLHLVEDLGNDGLSLGERQVMLDVSMTVELPVCRVCQSFF